MAGASLQAAVQFPDKVKLQAPVLGEEITVCRNGDNVWAYPGAKVEFLLKRFKGKPPPTKKKTPLYLPITPQQAIFLPALFTVARADVAEVQTFNGEDCRVITAGLMPELARSAKAEGFRARMWVAPGYFPRRMEITQPDFVAVTDIKDLKFSPSLPASTWQPPTGRHRHLLDKLGHARRRPLCRDEFAQDEGGRRALAPDKMNPTPASSSLP